MLQSCLLSSVLRARCVSADLPRRISPVGPAKSARFLGVDVYSAVFRPCLDGRNTTQKKKYENNTAAHMDGRVGASWMGDRVRATQNIACMCKDITKTYRYSHLLARYI